MMNNNVKQQKFPPGICEDEQKAEFGCSLYLCLNIYLKMKKAYLDVFKYTSWVRVTYDNGKMLNAYVVKDICKQGRTNSRSQGGGNNLDAREAPAISPPPERVLPPPELREGAISI